jgi:hypothetical protein
LLDLSACTRRIIIRVWSNLEITIFRAIYDLIQFSYFLLDSVLSLLQMEKLDPKLMSGSSSRRLSGIGESSNSTSSFQQPIVRIEMEDIVFMTPTADLSLPSGGGFRIDTTTGPQYLVRVK